MSRPRFTIGKLLRVMVVLAVAFASLREATDLWEGGMLGLCLLSVVTAVLMTVHRKQRKRAFWLGFALFGWTYLVASLIPPIESRLPTTKFKFRTFSGLELPGFAAYIGPLEL